MMSTTESIKSAADEIASVHSEKSHASQKSSIKENEEVVSVHSKKSSRKSSAALSNKKDSAKSSRKSSVAKSDMSIHSDRTLSAISNASKEFTPNEKVYMKAKQFLLSQTNEQGYNLFEHISACLKKILEERPPKALDVFEDISSDIKKKKFSSDVRTVDRSTEIAFADLQKKLFKRAGDDDDDTALEEEMETPLPNLMQTAFFFEQAGVGLNREELLRIWLSMKTLVDSNPIEKVRLWGKILGIDQNYYVVEAEYREGEEVEEEEEEEEQGAGDEAEARDEGDDDEDEEAVDLPPVSTWKPQPPVPKEDSRMGANKKIYFVTNDPAKVWIKLPAVTPAQISGARKIKKLFTGRLDAKVLSYPTFPGLEINLLRAQIARISAGTQISPIGFYTFDDEEEEEEEEGAVRENYIENAEYEPVPLRDLVDPNLNNWVHHTLHILPQGRCSWWNPSQKNEDEFEEEDEEEEGEESAGPEPEHGPPLLTTISDDLSVDHTKPWSIKLSSTRIPQYAVAVVSSNLWPGAHCFAIDRTFENIYIGFGTKYTANNYTPPEADKLMSEYTVGPEITEATDPTPEEEAALRAAQMAGEEGEEEIEEEEEDD